MRFSTRHLVLLPLLEEWLPSRIVASAGGGDSRRDIEAVKRFIEEHLAESFDVSELSRRARLTRPHFTRVFREQEGVPPWAYVLDRRVRRAAELLDEGAPPSEAALESGSATRVT
jgi:AraC-like DNA-binding protein